MTQILQNVGDFRYELLTGIEYKQPIVKAQEILSRGWSRRGYPVVKINQEIPWNYTLDRLRSWNFYIHSLDMIDSLLAAFDETGQREFLEPAVTVAMDWVRTHPRSAEGVSDMAWYDMAVGLRSYRLAFLYQAAARIGLLSPHMRKAIWTSLEEHRYELADDRTIAFHNNHGYYQIAGQLALGRRFANVSPSMMHLYQQGVERFIRMLNNQFGQDDVHLEHSPDYHRMILDTLQGIIRAGLIEEPRITDRSLRIEETLSWFVTPTGHLVNFGDSDHRSVLRSVTAAKRKWDTEAMQAVSINRPNNLSRPSGMKIFPASGYAVVRTPDPNAPRESTRDSYLAQTAAFHSRTHKHADDLSFIWHDHGESILVDAGRYGYLGKAEMGSDLWQEGHWYDNPMRVFVESTRAHNTVEFNSVNYPRKGVKPYGSALSAAGEFKSVYAITGQVKHFRRLWHDRTLVFRPREWLIVFDVFTDNGGNVNDAIQWFHAAPGSVLNSLDNRHRIETPKKRIITVVPMLPDAKVVRAITGQESPVIQGWWSGKEREAVPASAFGFEQRGRQRGSFATLFSFGHDVQMVEGANRANPTGRRARFSWIESNKMNQIDMNRMNDSLSIDYKSVPVKS